MTATTAEDPPSKNDDNDGIIKDSSSKLEIGDTCMVLWRDGNQELLAKIIERRPSSWRDLKRTERKKRKSFLLESEMDLPADQLEYYVHYVDHDRRLDEWVAFDKFRLDTLVKAPKMEQEEEDAAVSTRASRNSNTLQPLRRKLSREDSSSPVQESGLATKEDSTSFRIQGGNWHGSSGDPSLEQLEKEHEEITKVKNVNRILIGNWEVEAWYFSPYPEEYDQEDKLYVCEYCLKYMRKRKTYNEHRATCTKRRPPGDEIYNDDNLVVFEVDGKENPVYCQNLCLLAKLFLDHKTLYYDTQPFYFYIVCELGKGDSGAHIVGYFSKEKVSAEDYNLACILTFPQYQQCGYGKFIISLSYELTKREQKTGSPEKPLSDLGKISYRSYWTHVLIHLLAKQSHGSNMSVKEISQETGIKTEDIISTLQSLNMIQEWKGQHVIYVKQDVIENYLKQDKRIRLCKSECLTWEPPSLRKKNENP